MTKNFACISCLHYVCYMLHPSEPPDLITLTILGKQHKLRIPPLYNILQFPITLSCLCPKTLLITVTSDTLYIHPAFTVRNLDSHLYKQTGKIIALYVSIYRFVDGKHEDKIF